MELKTKVNAEKGKRDILVTREFELPLELLFKAHVEAEIVEQWMGTKVLKLENQRHGSFQFETTGPKGSKLRFNGVIHEFSPNERITRTYEFENMPFGVQLQFLEFEKLTNDTSKLNMQIIYRSVEHRDQQLEIPFTQGINMAHNELEKIASKLK
jgi:uncharacterized protein YndB with AHSA1/START domain